MGFVTRFFDRVSPPSPELRSAYEAHADLWASQDAEETAGVTDESEGYLRLNDAADAASRQVPHGQTWRIWGGAHDVLRDRGAT
jgi:hypothetical protein